MKAALGVAAALWAAALLVLLCGSAFAAPTQVNVRIEGRSKTLFEGPIMSEGHKVRSYKGAGGSQAEDLAEHRCDGINPLDPENVLPGPTSTAASVDAMNTIGETQAMAGQWYPGFNDYFVKQWGSEPENAEAEGKSWGILVNNVFTNVGGCQYELDTGDEVLWVYNAFEFRPFLGLFAVDAHYKEGERPLTAMAQLGEPFEVEVLSYEDDVEDAPPAHPERTGAILFAGAEVAPVTTSSNGFQAVDLKSAETVTTGAEGKASITFTTPGWHRLKAGAPIDPGTGEEEAIRSNRLDVCVPAAGESGCGEPRADDQLRVPPRYGGSPEEIKEEPPSGNPTTPGPGGEDAPPSGQSQSQGTSTSNAPVVPPLTPSGGGQTLASSATRPVASVAVAHLDSRRLVLRLSATGTLVVKIAKRSRHGGALRWATFKTLRPTASKAGALTIKLPRLDPGNYRVSVAFAGAKSLARTFTVPHR